LKETSSELEAAKAALKQERTSHIDTVKENIKMKKEILFLQYLLHEYLDFESDKEDEDDEYHSSDDLDNVHST
jgi:hypothetical protein